VPCRTSISAKRPVIAGASGYMIALPWMVPLPIVIGAVARHPERVGADIDVGALILARRRQPDGAVEPAPRQRQRAA
jgi:hypothetical protein